MPKPDNMDIGPYIKKYPENYSICHTLNKFTYIHYCNK